MISYFGKQANGMAFTPSSETFGRAYALRYAETTLSAYLQGQERDYAVRDVIGELEALFGAGASTPANLLTQAMALDPDDAGRLLLVTKALDLIGQQVRADAALAAK